MNLECCQQHSLVTLDVQKPWKEVLSLVMECSPQDQVILQKILDNSTKELKDLKQDNLNIQKGIERLETLTHDVLKGIQNLKVTGTSKPSNAPTSDVEAANQGDGAKSLTPTQDKHSDKRIVESAGSAKETRDRKPEATFYAFDRSDSMRIMGNAPAEALFMEKKVMEYKPLDGDFVCIQAFHDQIDPPLHRGPAKELKKLTEKQIKMGLSPQGMTALNDAIANVMLKAMEFRESNPGHMVAVFIYTDGEETSSEKYGGPKGLKEVNSLVLKARDMGIHVIFIAANIDAIKTGEKFGVPQGSCLQAGQSNFIGLTFARKRIRALSSGQSDHLSFSERQRADSICNKIPGPRKST